MLVLMLSACASEPKGQPIPRASGGAPMPGPSAAPAGAAQATGQDRLPEADALTATEQAIQLDELIKWVRAQAASIRMRPTVNGEPWRRARVTLEPGRRISMSGFEDIREHMKVI